MRPGYVGCAGCATYSQWDLPFTVERRAHRWTIGVSLIIDRRVLTVQEGIRGYRLTALWWLDRYFTFLQIRDIASARAILPVLLSHAINERWKRLSVHLCFRLLMVHSHVAAYTWNGARRESWIRDRHYFENTLRGVKKINRTRGRGNWITVKRLLSSRIINV